MNGAVAKRGGIVIAGMLLVLNQGCGMKWLQSGGETESASTSASPSGSASLDGHSQLPSLAPDRFNRELSGFSQHPTEERLAAGGFATSRSPLDAGYRRSAEFAKEEQLALEAGFAGRLLWV